MTPFTNFLDQLKLRNVRKTMAIYISTALTTIGVAKLFTEVYEFTEIIERIKASIDEERRIAQLARGPLP